MICHPLLKTEPSDPSHDKKRPTASGFAYLSSSGLVQWNIILVPGNGQFVADKVVATEITPLLW